MEKIRSFIVSHYLALSVAMGTFVSGVLYTSPASASVIDLKEVTKTVETEITANLGTLETVFGILLTIGVLFRLYRRFVN